MRRAVEEAQSSGRPLDHKSFTFVCSGTGIAPAYQMMCKLLTTPGEARSMVLLGAARTPAELLLKDEIDELVRRDREQGLQRLQVVYVVGASKDDKMPTGWANTDTYTAKSGFVDERLLRDYACGFVDDQPQPDTLVVVSGSRAMTKALCGPREEKALAEGSVLHQLGYCTDQVLKLH